jgi:hypothetical protein
MAPQGSGRMRHVWRVGSNEFKRYQDDLGQLSLLLARRPDGSEPKNLRTLWTIGLRRLYAHGTLQEAGDTDEFAFKVVGAGSVTFEVWAGIWLDPTARQPEHGLEPNFRPRLEIVDPSRGTVLACPDGLSVSLSAAGHRIIDADCEINPQTLQPDAVYRIRLSRHANSVLEGNLGRYTIFVRGPVAALSWPPRARP